MKVSVLLGSSLLSLVSAQNTAYGQCGGKSWQGVTTCTQGYTCVAQNDYYSQCVPGSAGGSPATTPATTLKTTTSAGSAPAATGNFKWLGVDESGAEFGQTTIPGVYNKDFTFPATSSLDTLMSNGFNVFRVPFLMERMVNTLTSPLNSAYLANYTATIKYITDKGGWAIVDPHNYGRFNSAIITDTTGFQSFWKTLAATFKSNSKVIFDTNNEYNTEDQTLVLNMNQAAINGIRAAGATSQYIFVEGNAWTGAWSWNTTNDNMKALTDPNKKIVYEMHQYLDSDDSGTSATCVSSDIGAQRVVGATKWLRDNGKVGIIGEFAAGANSVCLTAVQGMLDHMKANSDVWMGAIWWGGGPWWGDYIYSFEPPSGVGYTYYLSTLQKYKP